MALHPSLSECMAAVAIGISILTWFRGEVTRLNTQKRQFIVESGTVIKALCDSFAVLGATSLISQIGKSEQLRPLFMGQFMSAQSDLQRLRTEAERWHRKQFYAPFLTFYESWVKVGTISLKGQPLAEDAEKWSEGLEAAIRAGSEYIALTRTLLRQV